MKSGGRVWEMSVCVCVCLSEEKRKKMKENEWWGIVGLGGARVVQ